MVQSSVSRLSEDERSAAAGAANRGFDDSEVVRVVSKQAQYPGGPQAWQAYVDKNLNKDLLSENDCEEMAVFISFIVDKLGKVWDAKIIRGPEGKCADEIIRLIETSKGWQPGESRGQVVHSLTQIRLII